jgi:methoxymalonate biosynthesis acyl carrier protein
MRGNPTVNDRKLEIKQFLSRFFNTQQLNDDDDIFSLGVVNSLLALQLVNFLEKGFSITIEDEDLDIDEFRTLNSMDKLVERKLTARAAV